MSKKISLIVVLSIILKGIVLANLTNTWEFTNRLDYYMPEDGVNIMVDEAPPGVAKLILHARSVPHAEMADYLATGASNSFLKFGPPASLVLRKSGTTQYFQQGIFTSRILEGPPGNIWNYMTIKASHSGYIPDPDLVALYRMDNDGWKDYVTGQYATPTGGPSFVTDSKVGSYAGKFRGPSYQDAVETLNKQLIQLSPAVTIAFWVKAFDYGEFGTFVYFVDEPSRQFQCGVCQGPTAEKNLWGLIIREGVQSIAKTPVGSFPTNQWVFLTMTYDGNGDRYTRIYTNGLLGAVATSQGHTAIGQNRPFWIGGWQNYPNNSRYANAIIDEVAIWKRALTSNEIAQLYLDYSRTYPARFQVRSGDSPESVTNNLFVGPDGTTNTFYYKETEQLVSSADFNTSNRWAQYRVYLYSSVDRLQSPYIESAGMFGTRGGDFDCALYDFNSGAFELNTTTTPSSGGAYVGLSKLRNGSYQTNAIYTSRVITNSAGSVSWNELSWKTPAEEIDVDVPANQLYGLLALYQDNWSDETMHGYNGTPSRDFTTDMAKLGSKSFEFNGVNDFVSGFGITSGVRSVEFWIKTDSADASIMQFTGGTSLAISNRMVVPVGFAGNPAAVYVNGSSRSPKLLGGWNHVVVVWDSPISPSGLTIGRVGAEYFKGAMDEIALWSRVLGSGEIREHFVRGRQLVGGKVRFQVRISNDPTFAGVPFTGPGGNPSAWYVASPATLVGSGRYIQYRFLLEGPGDATPGIVWVKLTDEFFNEYRDDNASAFYEGDFAGGESRYYGDRITVYERAGIGPENMSLASQPNLIGLWHFDNDWSDSAGAGGATPSGGPRFSPVAKVGSHSVALDGVDDRVTLGSPALGASPFSVSLWFNSRGTNRCALISSYTGGAHFTIELNGDGSGADMGRVAFVIDDNSSGAKRLVSARGGLNNGEWHNIIAMRNENQILLYVDGDLVGVENIGSSYGNIGGGSPVIGYRSDMAYYEGFIDEVGIFNVALSRAQIGEICGAGYATADQISKGGVFTGTPVDAGQPAIWQELSWNTHGIYGNAVTSGVSVVGLWHLNETGGGVAIDASGNGNNGAVTGTQGVQGRFSYAVRFNGFGDRVVIPDSIALEPPAISVEAWIYPDEVINRTIFNKRSATAGYELATDSSGRLYFWIGDGGAGVSVTAFQPLRSRQWNCVVGSFDGVELKVFVNGEPAGRTIFVGFLQMNAGQAKIGENHLGGGSFAGVIDEVAVYSRALNACEVADHYASGVVTLKFQGNSWDPYPPSGFLGPGGSASTYFTDWLEKKNLLGNINLARYFQYRAYLYSEDHRLPPILQGIIVDHASYPTTNPSVEPIPAKAFYFPGRLLGFEHGTNAGERTEVRYQITGDSGATPTWYYWSGSQWAPATLGYPVHASTRETINTYIGSFFDQLYPKTGANFRFKAFLHSEGDYPIEVDWVRVRGSKGRIVVLQPNGEERGTKAWVVGVPYDIRWTSDGSVSDNLIIELYNQSGSNLVAVLASGVANTGSYRTVISEVRGENYRIRIRDATDSTIEDWSDDDFWLVEQLHLTSPDGGEFWYIGQTNVVRWDSPKWGANNLEGTVELWFSNDNGTNWFVVATVSNVSGNNAYAWLTPTNNAALVSETARMGVATPGAIDPVSAFYGDISDAPFTNAGIAITYPSAGTGIKMGNPITIQWTAAGAGTNGVRIDLFNGVEWTNLTMNAPCVPGTNGYDTVLTAPNPTEGARLRIISNSDPLVWGVSRDFVLADINVLTPKGGTEAERDQWQIGTTNIISWTSGGAGDSVHVEYSTDLTNWYPIAMNYPNTNSSGGMIITNYAPPWVVSGPPSSNAYVRVRSISQSDLYDMAGPFDISGVQIVSPNGSEYWEFTGTNEIRWLYRAAGAFLGIDVVYVSNPTTNDYETIVPSASIFSGRYVVNPGLLRRPSTVAKIRIRALNPPSGIPMVDLSDNVFTIRGLVATYPTNGAVYTLGRTVPDGLQWYSARTEDTTAELFYSPDGSNFNDVIMFSGIPFIGNIDADPSWNHQTWVISEQFMPSTNARVKVVAGAYSAVTPPFTMRGIRMTRPVAGDMLDIGVRETLRWASAGLALNAWASNSVSTVGRSGPYISGGLPGNVFVRNNSAFWDVDPELDPTTNAVIKIEVTTPTNDTDVVMYSDPFTLRGLKVISPAQGVTWALGSTQTVSFLSAGMGPGAVASVYYSPDGTNFDTIAITNGLDVADGLNSFVWRVEDSPEIARLPSTNARIRVICGTYQAMSKDFRVSGIKVTVPRGSDIWAVSDLTNTIKWAAVDASGPYSLYYRVWDSGGTRQLIASGVNGLEYDWTMTSNAIGTNVTIEVDGGGFTGTSERFEIVAKPSVKIVNPMPGEFWKVTETNTIRWVRGGRMSNDFWLAYSPYPFNITNVLGVGQFPFADGMFSYTWENIPNALGPTRIIVSNQVNSDIIDVFENFEIAPKFEIQPFVGELYALEPKPVNWITRGSVSSGVDFYYSIDPNRATNRWVLINPDGPFTQVAHDQPSTYLWTLPNVKTNTVWLRIQDHRFSNRMFSASQKGPYDDIGMLEVKYYTITWRVFDSSTSNELDQLSVSDSVGWSASGLQSPVVHEYPYGIWDTVWFREFFHDKVVFKWLSKPSRTNEVWMERAEVEPDYHVLANFVYNTFTTNFSIQAWLERGGMILEHPERCTIKVYDYNGNLLETITSTEPRSGVFWMIWDASTVAQTYPNNAVFFARVEIRFSGVTYSSGLTFMLRMTASEEIGTVIDLIQDTTSQIRDDISGVSSNVSTLTTNLAIFRGETISRLDSITNSTALLQAGVTNIQGMVTNLTDALTTYTNQSLAMLRDISTNVLVIGPSVSNLTTVISSVTGTVSTISDDVASDLARILTRPTTVPYGSTNTILYKTKRGYTNNVVLTVSELNNTVRYAGMMTEVLYGLGIYQHEIIANWGTNSYIITCSDPGGKSDKMILTVTAEGADVVSPLIAGLSNRLENVALQMTAISNLVNGIAGFSTTDIMDGLGDLETKLIQVQTAVSGIKIPEATEVDLSGVTRIESRLGSVNDDPSSSTFFGRLSAISSSVRSAGTSAAEAAKNAQTAKTQASTAAGGIQTLKDQIAKGDLEGALRTLRAVRSSMEEAMKALTDIPSLVRVGELYDELKTMAQQVQTLAKSKGYEFLVNLGETPALAPGEKKDEGENVLGRLTSQVEEVRDSVSFVKKLLEEGREPVVEEYWVGAE